jgi:hypothetical protein
VFSNLLIALGATLLLLIPGLAVALTWQSKDDESDAGPLWHLLLALGWGFGLVPFLAFCYALFSGNALTPWTTILSALLVTSVALSWWVVVQKKEIPEALKSGWRKAWPPLFAAAVVGLIYLLKYDRSVFFLESCIHRVVIQTLQLTDNLVDILASNQDDQRLGNTGIISSFVVLYRGMGFRVLYGFVGFVTALGAYLLALRVLKSRAWAWFALVALPLNPFVASIPLLDENLLTLGYSSLFLPLLMRRNVPFGHVGALFGLSVMMRHTGILCAPAMCYALWRFSGNRKRAFLWAFVAFNLVTLVAHIHHYAALGSVFRFESFGQIPAFEHNIIGSYSGLLQWPFADHILRTPWNPYPVFLLWPLHLADTLGLVLFGALLLGAVALFRRRRDEGVFWLIWFLPLFGALSLQENWDVPNKLGVIYVLFHPLILWSAAGLQAAAEAPRKWGVALVGVVLLTALGVRGVRHLQTPQDERYYEAWPGERVEEGDYVKDAQDRITEVAPWPDYSRLGALGRVFHPEKWSGLWRDIADPALDRPPTPYGWFYGEKIDPQGTPIVVELDLSRRLFDSTGWLKKVDDDSPIDVDLTVEGPARVIPNITVPWSTRAISVLITKGRAEVTGMSLIFEKWGRDKERLDYLHERYHRGLMMVLGWQEDELFEARVTAVQGSVIRVKIYPGPFSLIENINNAGQNYLFWRAWMDSEGPLSLEGPSRIFHN